MTKRSDIKEIARPENGTSSSRIQSGNIQVRGDVDHLINSSNAQFYVG
jgi:hypothetical protein